MFAYRAPGVVFEWRDVRTGSIDILRTDIAGFVGIAERGPLHQPVKIESWTQFTSVFGRYTPQGFLAHAVAGFLNNGGRTCYVVRVANPLCAQAAALTLYDDNGAVALRLIAANRYQVQLERPAERRREAREEDWLTWRDPGVWGARVSVRVVRSGRDRFTLRLQLDGEPPEVWADLSMQAADRRYVCDVINNRRSGSRLVYIEVPERAAVLPPAVPDRATTNMQDGSVPLEGGSDGLATLTLQHLTGVGAPPDTCWGLATLAQVDEISVVAIPDLMPKPLVQAQYRPPPVNCRDLTNPVPAAPAAAPLEYAQLTREETQQGQRDLIAHCEALKDRMALLDPHPDDIIPAQLLAWRRAFDTSYAALYYPWLMVDDPFQDPGTLRAIPPSGYVAGIYARVDNRRGVHEPPANEELIGVRDLAPQYATRRSRTPVTRGADQSVLAGFDDALHALLNDEQVNVIRPYPGRGMRIAGARTLSSDTALRFVNVRRLLIMIEEAIDQRTQWTVFEPNNRDLWRDVDRVVRAFLDDLWRAGMLDGSTAADAYSVRCNDATNLPFVRDRGLMVCEIGVLPPWPAEFVIVRIGRSQDATLTISESGA